MSVLQMALVWELDLEPREKIILLAYADHADDDGDNVYPSLRRVAWKTGYSVDTVRRVSRKLKDKLHLMELVERGHGRGHTHRYRLTLAKGSKLQPFNVKASGGEKVADGPKKVADGPTKGSRAMLPEPSIEPSIEPSDTAAESDDSPPSTQEVKPKELGNYLLGYLMDLVADKRERGKTILDPPEKGRIGARFRELAASHEIETMELAARYMVDRATGEVDPDKPYWCFVDAALREVLDGWRPRAALRAVPDPELEREREELEKEWADLLKGVS